VRRYKSVDEVDTCHILFIGRSQLGQLDAVVAALKDRNVLTVGDFEGFTSHGGIIRFVTVGNKIRLRINLAAAQQAKLDISSKLLRPAHIVAPGED
jgi:YfiR/HmsC-like